jgi:hypothetical protein
MVEMHAVAMISQLAIELARKTWDDPKALLQEVPLAGNLLISKANAPKEDP